MRLIVQELERLQFGTKATVTTIGELATAIPTLFSPEQFRNIAAVRRETEEARRDGFTAKMAIHPAQVPVIR